MQVSVKIESDYRGSGKWTDEFGLSVDLKSILAAYSSMATPNLPPVMPITIDEGKKNLLVDPYFSQFGGMELKTGNPITTSATLRAEHMVVDVPWDPPVTPMVKSIKLSSRALNLWYGEDTSSIELDDESDTITAQFKRTQETYDTKHGKLEIELGIKFPGFPNMGNYHFRTQAYAVLYPPNPVTLGEAVKIAYAMEGYFDLLAGFPQRDIEVKVDIEDIKGSRKELKLAIGPARKSSDDHPFGVFISKAELGDFTNSFERYVDAFHEIGTLQSALRYLSGDKLTLPEGFLMACNIIESIGKEAPNSNEGVPDILDEIYGALAHKDSNLADTFKKSIRPKVYCKSSFRDRYLYVSNILSEFGIDVTLKAGKMRDTRAAYRHDIVSLNNTDLEIMRSGIGISWFSGMVWLCNLEVAWEICTAAISGFLACNAA